MKRLEEIQLSERLRSIAFDEKVRFVYSYFNKQNAWEESHHSKTTTKSTEKSINFREAGNEFHRIGRHKDAQRLYTESVAVALPESAELSLAFANRSAASYRLGNYSACLQDINRSLAQKCPESVQQKLRKRKDDCLAQIEAENRTKSSLQRDFLGQANEDESLDLVKRNLEAIVMKPDETEPSERMCSLPVIENENNVLPNTTAKVTLQFSEVHGYHVIACQDILPGEIITHEEAFSSVLDRNFRLTHCSYCFVKSDALLSCEGCSVALFCGETCRTGAYNAYHRVECEIASFLQDGENEFPYHFLLPLRTLLIGSEQGKKLKKLMKDPNLLNMWKNKRPLRVDERQEPHYVSICNLFKDVDTLPPMSMLGFCLKSSCLIFWLKHSSLFSDQHSSGLTDVQAFAGSLLLNHFVALVFNAFSVTETTIPVAENETANYTIGTCLQALCSRFNHSCDPNADFYSNKNSLIIYSHRPIAAGEQVFISYESHYHSAPRSNRRTSLNQYGFVCQCTACEGDWPLYDHLPRKPTLLRNLSVTKNSMATLYGKYEKLWRSSHSGGMSLKASEGLLRFLCEFSTAISVNFVAPLQLQIACQNAIEKLLSTRGNFYADCYDTEKYMSLLDEYLAVKTDMNKLRVWIRDFLVSDV